MSLGPIARVTFSLTVSDIGFGRSFILEIGRCLDSIGGHADKSGIHGGGSFFFQKLLDDSLKLAIFALTEMVIANPSFAIYEILRRPVLVVECPPNLVVAVNGNWIRNHQIAHGFFYVLALFFE